MKKILIISSLLVTSTFFLTGCEKEKKDTVQINETQIVDEANEDIYTEDVVENNLSSDSIIEETLSAISKDSQINFENVIDTNLSWLNVGDTKEFEGKGIESGEVSKRIDYFIDWFTLNGFKEDLNQSADGAGGSRVGFTKEDVGCVVMVNLETNVAVTKGIKIICGKLE